MITLEFIDSIEAVAAADWNAVAGTDYPFTRHEFLSAMEASGATTADTGWQPHHCLVYRDRALAAVMPLFLKYHSYGEYVFDWAWADAWRRHGLSYYPKLLCAAPYTPVTGPRLCVAPGEDAAAIRAEVVPALQREAETRDASSVHILFPEREQADALQSLGLSTRIGPQYHWFNRGYSDFDDFLAAFNSRKRKSLRRERRRVAEQGLRLRVVEGRDIDAKLWRLFFHCYQLTYAKRSGHGGYLNEDCFRRLGAALPEHLVMVVAEHEGEFVAAALNFRDSRALYGRYWGCLREYENLHFEACYYQGIDYCIARGLERFDPGAQGEHKILRGFEPVPTYSSHWIRDSAFREAIDRFLTQETRHIEQYLAEARTLLPFRKG